MVYNRNELNKGFTLLELLAVMAILSILAAIAIPSYLNYIAKTEKKVCYANSLKAEKMYKAYFRS